MIGDSAPRPSSDAWLLGITAWPSLAGVTKNALNVLFKAASGTRRNCGWMLLVLAVAIAGAANPVLTSAGNDDQAGGHWVGTWATASQPSLPGNVRSFQSQSVRLIVHTSAGGKKVRIKISNTYGD